MKDQALIPLHYQINIWATRKGITYSPRADENTLAQFVKPQ
jgi:peptide/nickel transport system substrate-binding protein